MQPEGGAGQSCPTHGGVLVRALVMQSYPNDPLLGRCLDGRYALYDVLGRGGMGAVYRGRHLKLGRDVAVKTIRREERDTHPDFDVRERFFLEARMLAGLRSPGIVSLLDYGEDDGLLYMVLELLEGVTLHTLLKQGGLTLDRAVGFAVGMLDALSEPHAMGLVHRDIKPSNVMVRTAPNGSESVTLIDFGVAKAVESDDDELSGPATRTGLTIGTPRYMSPEQLAHLEVGPFSDQYAVAVVLYRMIAGRTPFTGPPAVVVAAHLKDPAPPLPPEIEAPASVQAVLDRALSKHPDERFPSCAAMADALRAALGEPVRRPITSKAPHVTTPVPVLDEGEGESVPFTPPWRGELADAPVAPERPKRRAGLMIVSALATAAVVLAVLMLDRPPEPAPVATAEPARVQIGAASPRPAQVAPISARPATIAPPTVPTTEAAPPSAAPPSVAAPATAPASEARPAASPPKPQIKKARRRVSPVRRPIRRPKKPAATAPSVAPVSAAARPVNDSAARFTTLLQACRCDAARGLLDDLPADRRPTLRRAFRARCEVVGLGCNAPERL